MLYELCFKNFPTPHPNQPVPSRAQNHHSDFFSSFILITSLSFLQNRVDIHRSNTECIRSVRLSLFQKIQIYVIANSGLKIFGKLINVICEVFVTYKQTNFVKVKPRPKP